MDDYRKIGTSSIKIDIDVFSVSEQQWVKASIATIIDHALSFGIPGTPVERILSPPGAETPRHDGARVLQRVLASASTTKTTTSMFSS